MLGYCVYAAVAVVSVCAVWSALVDELPAVGGRAVGGMESAAWTTVNSDSAVNVRPEPYN